jgi:hypothetical protein
MASPIPATRKVLTIRNPQDGSLLAKGRVEPGEDTEAALLRIYRRTLGSEAPALQVLSKAEWPNRNWKGGLARKWGNYQLVIVGPGDSNLETSTLLLARIAEAEPKDGLVFPSYRKELKAMKQGRRHDAVVPVDPENPPVAGDIVTFRETGFDPFGSPIDIPGGDSLSVTLTESQDQGTSWLGRRLYQIAWDPEEARRKSVRKSAPNRAT